MDSDITFMANGLVDVSRLHKGAGPVLKISDVA